MSKSSKEILFLLSPHFSRGQNAESPVSSSLFPGCSETLATLASVRAKLSCFLLVKMPACSASGCKNRLERDNGRGLSFHRLPAKNITLAKKWLEQLRRDEKRVPKNLYVCNEHFTDDCFETGYRFELLGGRTRRRSLKKDAFPTIFQRKGPVKTEKRIKEVSYLIKLFSF